MLTLPQLPDAQSLAQAIVDTIHEPLLVLDDRFHVLAASRSFYSIFQVDPEQTIGGLLYDLGDGQWNIPALRVLLETIIPERAAMDGFEVDHDFPGLGRRTMLLNARKVVYATSTDMTILLAFTDVTERRAIERDKALLLARTEELLGEKQTLLQEMQHRVANSLQIIASILLLKARAVASDETRRELKDAHQRVMSVAEVQTYLHAVDGIDQIEVAPYLAKLCAGLSASMVGESQAIAIEVTAGPGRISSQKAVSLGLIVTELVINAIKYAFPAERSHAHILITFEAAEDGGGADDWRLTVSDNGVGKNVTAETRVGGGLGAVIVDALVKQLGATMTVLVASGVTISIAQGDFHGSLPRAA
jgi:chemotaxis protein methyltransferase CheR